MKRTATLDKFIVVAAALVALFALSIDARAQQRPYTDDDSAYLKVIDTFAYPVGVLLEWTIFRPLHALETRGVQGIGESRVQTIGTTRVLRGCHSERPPRYCSDPRYMQ